MHLLLVGLFLRPHLSNFILQGTDEAEIVVGDVVVVALDKIEGLLMIHEEIVDVLILALLNFMDVLFSAELQIDLEIFNLLIILTFASLVVGLEGFSQLEEILREALLEHLYVILICQC